MNSVYDPDPSLGSGSISGFAEWAAMYRYYRVIGFGYDVTISNMETFPVAVGVVPASESISSATAHNLAELPYAKSSLLSGKGGLDKVRFSGYHPLADLVGESTLFYSDNYASAVTTNPASLLYFSTWANCDGAHTLGNGVFQMTKYYYSVIFYKKVPNLA